MQCGFCSSCLLRRQALAVLGIQDRTAYITTHSMRPRTPDSTHLKAMLDQVNRLHSILNVPNSWQVFFTRYPPLADFVYQTNQYDDTIPEQRREQLLQLYERYVKEWDSVQSIVGQELLYDAVHIPLHNTITDYQQEQMVWI